LIISSSFSAHARGWDHLGQDELAVRAVRQVRPDWSDIQALSTVDWVRSLAASVVPAIENSIAPYKRSVS
jgi:hypothetical protein